MTCNPLEPSCRVMGEDCEEVVRGLSTDSQDSFARLLQEEDADLLNWFSLESSPEDNELRSTIRAILKWKRDSQGIN